MSKINLITQPDKLFNDAYSILLIDPSDETLKNLQHILSVKDKDCNVYLYSSDNIDIEWLLVVIGLVDIVIFDYDNAGSVREFSSYIISKSKTYWLTKVEFSQYNKLTSNKIYDLDWLEDKI